MRRLLCALGFGLLALAPTLDAQSEPQVFLVPRLFGIPMGTLRLFQPDLALAMIAGAVTGVLWALFRLGLAYSGRSSGTSSRWR